MHLTLQPAEVSRLHNPVGTCQPTHCWSFSFGWCAFKTHPKRSHAMRFLGCELALQYFPGVFSFTTPTLQMPNQDMTPGVALMKMVPSPCYLSDGWFSLQKGWVDFGEYMVLFLINIQKEDGSWGNRRNASSQAKCVVKHRVKMWWE